jgi:hypothetical protein
VIDSGRTPLGPIASARRSSSSDNFERVGDHSTGRSLIRGPASRRSIPLTVDIFDRISGGSTPASSLRQQPRNNHRGLPTCFLNTRNQAAEGQVPEADPANAELTVIATRTSAQAAAVPMLNRKLTRRLRLDLLGLGRHTRLTNIWKRTTRSLVPIGTEARVLAHSVCLFMVVTSSRQLALTGRRYGSPK